MKKKAIALILALTSSMVLGGCNIVAEEVGSMLGKAASEAKESEERNSEEKESETKETESKESEAKESEAKESETKESEAKESEAKESETKESAEKESESGEPAHAETSTEMSDDLWSFQVAINGDVYQFPMWYSDFEAMGWTYEDDSSEKLSSDEYIPYTDWTKDEMKVYTNIANMSSNSKTVEESAIVKIEIDYTDEMKEKNYKVELPGGIVLGESNKEDVIAAYGEPESLYETEKSGYACHCNYSQGWYQNIDFFWNADDEIVYSVSLENKVKLEGTDDSVSAEVPEVVNDYVAPTALGEDLYSFDVKINGNYYTLPAPVSAFLDNGYELYDHTKGDKDLGAGGTGYVTMKYGDVGYIYSAINYADYATTIDNCFIYSFDVSSTEDTELEIPLGIKIGDTEEDLVSKLEGYDYKKYDVGKVGADYVVKTKDDFYSGYEFEVDSGIITKIIVTSR